MPRTSRSERSAPSSKSPSGKRPRRTGPRRLIPGWRVTVAGLVTSLLLGTGGFVLAVSLVQVPDAHAAATAQSNTWLYQDGSVIARTGQTNRQNVALDKVSPAAQHAALAAEDRDFYHEGAVNVPGLLRAAVKTAKGEGTQGGSTITQQYVKNTYLSQQQSVGRKVKELFIALKVDATETKDDVLAGYLNTSYYGRGAYGIQAGAQAYFGVDAAALDPAQGAYLATLLNAPSAYDVATATATGKQNAMNRWNYVLDGMVKENWLSADERAAVAFPEVKEPQAAPGLSGQAGYLVNAATDYLVSHQILSEAALAKGGYTVKLSIDPAREQDLSDAVQSRLTADLKPGSRPKDAAAQAGAVSVDPKTGAVLALYGGTDYTKHFVDNATRRDYQAGSTFKAIALAAALDSNARTQSGQTIGPRTVYDGTSGRKVRGGTGTPYAAPNEGGKDYGQITLQQATDWSVNSVFTQLAQDTGLEKVRDTGVALGLPAGTPSLGAQPSLPLGVATPSVLDMAGVYATLDNGGRQITPWLVQSLEHEGRPVALPAPQVNQAVSEQTANRVTAMLRGVVDDPGGTGFRAQALGRPAAGKTGTTDDQKSVWFVGYTPELVTAVALFGQDPATGAQVSLSGTGGTDGAAGGQYPAQIWTAYMKAALKGTPVTGFPVVAGQADGGSGRGAGSTPSASASPSPAPSTPAAGSGAPTAGTGGTGPSDPSEQGSGTGSGQPGGQGSGSTGRPGGASSTPAGPAGSAPAATQRPGRTPSTAPAQPSPPAPDPAQQGGAAAGAAANAAAGDGG
ncbi:penicillin-binding protein [Kitasatospora indigofera]|uniref:Penicillin-binding protein n=1 Tax=Kitasatospora indigofera TaxID=67307 RepID=A0A919FQI1_9ACTN|nr:transglycosylase domain-containing protein [Kitasatospora indigofera]GHH70611.1 penicillin-binding protein [Kitasatospora indigofera]